MKFEFNDINRKEIPVGSVVYYLTTNRQGINPIWFGIVEEHYTTEICLQLYDFCERRMIDGVPVEEIKTPTRWQKLPKGWSYKTKLFELDVRPLPKQAEQLTIRSKDDILQAIKDGILVKVQEIDYGDFADVIDKEKGWRIERKYPYGKYRPWFISVRLDAVYTTYEQAKEVFDAELAELKRQSELSDYDWSVENIDKELNRWVEMYEISCEEKQRCRDWILALDKVEDVEVRLVSGVIQWKYWKHSKWKTIEY